MIAEGFFCLRYSFSGQSLFVKMLINKGQGQ